MRFKLVFLALNLVAAATHAQQMTSQAPPAAAIPGATPGAAAPGPAAVGIVTLSDVAKQAPQAGQGQPASSPDVPPITAVEGSGRLAEPARSKTRSDDSLAQYTVNIFLSRISTVGDDVRAVLWVKGQYRQVVPGMRVLQYTVGEIRDDGVCLYRTKAAAKASGKCPQLVTFAQGV